MKTKAILLLIVLLSGTVSLSQARDGSTRDPLRGFHTFEEIEALLLGWQKTHPAIYSLDTLAMSHQGRPVYGACISEKGGKGKREKPEILYVGTIHGCEPLSSEVMIRWMAYLLENHQHPYLQKLIQSRSFWMIPVLNPDGLTMHLKWGKKIWKANCNPNNGAKVCKQGVDLNRNFGYKWGVDSTGSKPKPGWQGFGSYRGAAPFSEPESRAVQKLVLSHSFVLSFSFHSFGNKYLIPYNYSSTVLPEDWAWYQAYARHLSLQNGYDWGNPASGKIYTSNGDMDDWLYGDRSRGKAKTLSMTVELGSFYLLPFGFPERHFRKNLYACLFMAEIASQPPVVQDPSQLSKIKKKLDELIQQTYSSRN